jgi:hypothetical protein
MLLTINDNFAYFACVDILQLLAKHVALLLGNAVICYCAIEAVACFWDAYMQKCMHKM